MFYRNVISNESIYSTIRTDDDSIYLSQVSFQVKYSAENINNNNKTHLVGHELVTIMENHYSGKSFNYKQKV